MNANVVPPDPLTEGERSDGEQEEVVYMCVSIPSASAHTGTEKTLTDAHY